MSGLEGLSEELSAMNDMEVEDTRGADGELVAMSTEPSETVLPRRPADSSSESWEETDDASPRKKESMVLTGKASTSFVAMAFICHRSRAQMASSALVFFDPMTRLGTAFCGFYQYVLRKTSELSRSPREVRIFEITKPATCSFFHRLHKGQLC